MFLHSSQFFMQGLGSDMCSQFRLETQIQAWTWLILGSLELTHANIDTLIHCSDCTSFLYYLA
jgi:hypothetical protein